jgi:hypothetical protein
MFDVVAASSAGACAGSWIVCRAFARLGPTLSVHHVDTKENYRNISHLAVSSGLIGTT